MFNDVFAIGIRKEYQFGCLQSQTVTTVNFIHNHFYIIIICESIGHIEEIEIDASICQHLHVAGYNEWITTCIVA